ILHVLPDALRSHTRGRGVDGGDYSRAYDSRIRDAPHLLHVLAGADAEADPERQVGVRANAFDEGREFGRELSALARGSRNADAVEEGVGHRGEFVDPFVGGGGRYERDEAQAVCATGGYERRRFFGWEVDNDEAIGASLRGTRSGLLFAQ